MLNRLGGTSRAVDVLLNPAVQRRGDSACSRLTARLRKSGRGTENFTTFDLRRE